ncbi:uncharacterized protein LOC123879931 [Maniola jurtina]|uniref:uncharacterized protein LOC123879931 n=1 Tax=Maniola jurtina TaxID=191418 RepID=UPI001E68ECFE|nr:uncharacterized protein LOC123879931 [Maniola jurtina]
MPVDKISPESVEQSPLLQKVTIRKESNIEMELSVLFKFVKPYDGCRETLNSFLINCDNAILLASDVQKPILLKFILCQLKGKAEIACSIKDFTCWLQLKDFLKEQFCERKHYSHLLADLQESKQSPLENVSQFALKVETCLSQLLTEISLTNAEPGQLAGRTAAMEDLALHHFTMGLLPRISTIVRCRSPKTLNEAINIAVSEERIQQTLYRRSQPAENKGNKSRNSFTSLQKPSFAQRPANSQTNDTSSKSPVICRYCKSEGHVLMNCKKREYNNSRYRNPQAQAPARNLNSFSRPGPSRVNFMQEENIESRDEVDTGSENDYSPNHLNE